MMSKLKKRENVHNKYGGRCGYCGKIISLKEMQVDHISPLWASKDKSVLCFDNLMPSCRRCNHYKREKNLEQFRYFMKSLHERIINDYKNKVAIDFNIMTIEPFNGIFYFEK